MKYSTLCYLLAAFWVLLYIIDFALKDVRYHELIISQIWLASAFINEQIERKT